jgi:hypothetical protein
MRRNNSVGPDAEGRYRCSMCNEWKPAEGFHANSATKRGLSTRCRDCHSAYVRSPEMRAKNREVAARRFRSARDLLIELRSKPCTDCGQTFPPYCMEFDHVDRAGKSFTIGHLTGGGITPRFLREIGLCELVCSNCHRIRTRERDGIKPFGGAQGKGRPRKTDGEW